MSARRRAAVAAAAGCWLGCAACGDVPRDPGDTLAHVRGATLREEGRVFCGEALVVPADQVDLEARLAQALRECRQLDWRVHDLVLAPVSSLEDPGDR